MPWNGSGTYERLIQGVSGARGANAWTVAKAVAPDNKRVIFTADHDKHDQDLAAGITAALAKNGENTPTANLPMAGKRHTNVGNAESDNDYAAWGQTKALIQEAPVELTYAAAITWDLSAARVAKLTLTGNATLTASNPVEGRTYALWVAQDGTGSRTLTLPGASDLDRGDLPGTVEAAANEITLFSFVYIFGKMRLIAERGGWSNA